MAFWILCASASMMAKCAGRRTGSGATGGSAANFFEWRWRVGRSLPVTIVALVKVRSQGFVR